MKWTARLRPLFSLMLAAVLMISMLSGCSLLEQLGLGSGGVTLVVSTGKITLSVGASSQIEAAVTPAETAITYSCSDNSVAMVDNTGLVIGIAPGTVAVTVGAGAQSAVVDVTVVEPPEPVEEVLVIDAKTFHCDPPSVTIKVGELAYVNIVNPDGYLPIPILTDGRPFGQNVLSAMYADMPENVNPADGQTYDLAFKGYGPGVEVITFFLLPLPEEMTDEAFDWLTSSPDKDAVRDEAGNMYTASVTIMVTADDGSASSSSAASAPATSQKASTNVSASSSKASASSSKASTVKAKCVESFISAAGVYITRCTDGELIGPYRQYRCPVCGFTTDWGSEGETPTSSSSQAAASSQRETSQPAAPSGGERSDYANAVVDLVNEQRANAGVGDLAADGALMDAAMIRAQELVTLFSHTRPDGSRGLDIITGYGTRGENIAYGQASPAAVMNSWMNSSGHKANILKDKYTAIGVGCYQSGGRLYWVQLFGG